MASQAQSPVALDSTLAASGPSVEAAPPPTVQEQITPPIPSTRPPYWFGYLYGICAAYIAFASLTHVVVPPMPQLTSPDTQTAVAAWVSTIGLGLAGLWFTYAAIRLFRRRPSLPLVYTIAILHGLNVLFRGIVPLEVILWLVISGGAIVMFRRYYRQGNGTSKEDSHASVAPSASRAAGSEAVHRDIVATSASPLASQPDATMPGASTPTEDTNKDISLQGERSAPTHAEAHEHFGQWLQILRPEYKGTQDPTALAHRVLIDDRSVKAAAGKPVNPSGSSSVTPDPDRRWSILSVSSTKAAVLFFLVAPVALSTIFVINYDRGKRERQRADKNFATNAAMLLETIANGVSPSDAKVQSSGNPEMDAIMAEIIQLTGQVFSLLDRMEEEIDALRKESVFADSVIGNKARLASEMKKRSASQAIIEKYQSNFAPTVQAAREKIGSLNVSESVRRGALTGFNESVKKQAPRMEEMFKIRIRREKAEAECLQFMHDAFPDYRLNGKSISFSSSDNLQTYKKLVQEISLAEQAGEAFQKKQFEEFDAAKTKLREMAK
jgi:hypothetical protein